MGVDIAITGERSGSAPIVDDPCRGSFGILSTRYEKLRDVQRVIGKTIPLTALLVFGQSCISILHFLVVTLLSTNQGPKILWLVLLTETCQNRDTTLTHTD